MRVLFVCLGNICRSPTAEAVLRRKAELAGVDLEVDSAGTGPWHVGEAPDARAQQFAARRGYDLSALRGRQVSAEDFQRFDLILAMDAANLRHLRALRPAQGGARLDLYLRHVGESVEDVPDPYYGGDQGFEQVLDLLERASDRLLEELSA